MKKIIFFLLFVSSFARAQTITADQLSLDSLSGIYNSDYKVANDTINIVATKSDLLLKLDASDTTGIWQPLGNYASVSDLNLKADSVNKKAATDSVFYWINGTSYFAFRDSASAGSGTPSLTQNQIAFGDASNLMTSSSDFTYNNGIFTINHSANNSGLQFDPVTWMQSENYMNDGDDGWSYFPNITTAWWRNNGEWVWYDDGTNLLLRMDSGNVGIGTNAPTNTLHVNGSARITALGGGGTQMVTADNNGVLGVQAIPSGGTTPNLSSVLGVGNITGGNHLMVSDGDLIMGSGGAWRVDFGTDNQFYVTNTNDLTKPHLLIDDSFSELGSSTRFFHSDGVSNHNAHDVLIELDAPQIQFDQQTGATTSMATLSKTGVLGRATLPDLSNYIQNGDDVSTLVNDAGYLTSSTGLGTTLTNGKFLVGNGSDIATAVTPTGDVTFDNAGTFTIGAGKVTNAMLAGSIANAKLANSTISGISLGSNLATLSNGYGINTFSYNGSSIASASADTTTSTGLVSKTRLSNSIAGFGSGTVTSVATGLGLSGGTITTTGTLLVDTASASILSRQRAANTYQPIGSYLTAAVTSVATGLGLSGGTITTTGTLLVDTASASILSRQRAANTYAPISINGTVTSVATGLGLSGGAITTTGTLLVDTSSASILSRQRAVNTYLAIGSVINSTNFGATTSAQLRGVLSDELGNGAALFDGATPTSFVLTNATGLPAASINSGALASGMTATTQAFGTTNTTLATTAFVLARDTLSFLNADTTTAAGVTITIPGLTFTAGANQTWAFDAYFVGQCSGSGGIRLQVIYSTTPTTSTIQIKGNNSSTTTLQSGMMITVTPSVSNTMMAAATTELGAEVHGTIFNGGSACTVTIKGNPTNGAQTATFRKGCSIHAIRGQ